MSDRGLPLADAAPVCPFVALEHDRDARAEYPDHRHRCFAELNPAPRALAHQEAYCLSAAFPACPTFQDWARREAAQARARGGTPPPRPSAGLADSIGLAGSIGDAGMTGAATGAGRGPVMPSGLADDPSRGPAGEPDRSDPGPGDREAARRPRRNWAEPPPWAADSAGAPSPTDPPAFLADRGDPSGDPRDRPPLAQSAGARRGPMDDGDADDDGWPPNRESDRPSRGRGTGGGFLGRDTRPRVGQTRRDEPVIEGPSWERPQRYEAYPRIRTRIGVPGISRLAVAAVALIVAAVALFFLPALLSNIGSGPGGARATPTASPSVEPSAEITPTPAPTPQIYVIRSGDTLSKIAKRFGITINDLLAANKDRIKNPDRIAIGDEIIIPLPVPSDTLEGPVDTPEPSPAG